MTEISLPSLFEMVTFAPFGFELIWTVFGPPSTIEAQPENSNGATSSVVRSVCFIVLVLICFVV